ncbi:hypothetical protein MIND_00111800 [Mycena indigotica]|uniref:Uncharacterized protein n=1 Tax=Mycena indigotica TaxID=2126181 RepID=A0A8H6TBX9_9AGAR|nr:uncharacterized protein MIND_00111800 [Mycena indigotica]KAF7315950.1 hypothetical protein MIND_00111800 [Mycena indigotica]
MKTFAAITTLSFVNIALSLPTKRGVSDTHILNFALNLEYLQVDFYKQAVAQFPQTAFRDAGEPDWVYGRLQQMHDHDSTHAMFLSTALKTAGVSAVSPCDFIFSFTDARSVIEQATTLKSITTAAYNGALRLLNNRDYASIAASMMAVEARHDSWLNGAVLQRSAWTTAFEASLGPSQAFSALLSYIKSCPASNSPLLPGLNRFPALSLSNIYPGQTATVSFSVPNAPNRQLFAAFISGAGKPTFVPLEENNTRVKVPDNLFGRVFCVITSDGGRADDEVTVAGPSLVELQFNANGQLV